IITAAGGEISLSELASRAQLPLPTIHRLLRTLIPLGHVRQLPNRSYALGPGLIRLGNAAGLALGTYAQPVLQGLVDQLGESANM
ncbi:helix-turn-helix domain-containing protein, partial [Xanthomonas citri pv. citri]|nr:helix-turn-helix domain-containing protein [Xanthomonas citri pv. citri]